MTVRFGAGEIDPFFDVFSHHMHDLGTPTLPRRFFQSLGGRFPDDVWFGCAYHQGRAVAAGCGIHWDRKLEMTWPSVYKRVATFSARAGTTTPSPDDGAYAWGPRIWKRLPVSLTTAVGPSVVRYIP